MATVYLAEDVRHRRKVAVKVAEGLGDIDSARIHYSNLVRWWKDCDPDLVPVREEARQALARLSAEPGAAP